MSLYICVTKWYPTSFRIELAASNSEGFGRNASVTVVTLDFGELV